MSEYKLHPVLDRLYTIQDAALLYGLGDALKEGEIRDGEICGSFVPWTEMLEPPRFSSLFVTDLRTGVAVGLGFAPPGTDENPFGYIETDDSELVATRKQVMACCMVNAAAGVQLYNDGALYEVVDTLTFNFTGDSMVLSPVKDIAYDPIEGTFDGPDYRLISGILSQVVPLDDIMEFVTERL